MKKQLNKKGFTLIEVVLVLAIGGLIFLLAFLAFQQVSTNRRDTQRRSDAGRVVAELQNYKGDHSNNLPSSFSDFLTSYMGGANFKDPKGVAYTVWSSGDFETPQIKYTPGADASSPKACNGTTDLTSAEFKVEIALEKGSVCRDSLGSN